jgi:hypothetical protein
MAITYGFYNSVAGDRTYNAEQFGAIFDGIITDGIFELIGDAFEALEDSGMVVSIGTGKAWFNHTWTLSDAVSLITLDDSDLVLDRIDAIVLEVDSSDAVRANSIKKVTGTPASVPSEPTLTNTDEVHQYPLCWVYVGAGVTSILQANITNNVGSYLAPYVTVPQAGAAAGAAVLEVQVFS